MKTVYVGPTAPFKLTASYKAKCLVPNCKSVLEQDYEVRGGEPIPVLPLPLGWMVVNGCLICNHHEVVFKNGDGRAYKFTKKIK